MLINNSSKNTLKKLIKSLFNLLPWKNLTSLLLKTFQMTLERDFMEFYQREITIDLKVNQ